MKKPGFVAASIAAASATTAINLKNQTNSHQEYGGASSKNGEKTNSCCSEKFAPRFDGLRFIETLVTGHR